MNEQKEIVIYAPEQGGVQVEVTLQGESLWLSLAQIATLFQRHKSVISRHLNQIFASGELSREATVAKNATVQQEGKRKVVRHIEYYNLDAIISVGYRVNSIQGTQFRIWATNLLRQHLIHGYTLNQKRLQENSKEIEAALKLVQKAAASPGLTTDAGRGLIDIISHYTRTFLILQQYDEGLLTEPKGEHGGVLLSPDSARAAIASLKSDLIRRGETTELFAMEREQGLASILGNLEQTVLGAPAYPTIESKAAHLLYFIIKNHPFTDGNKHTAAFLFVDFLNRNKCLFNKQDEAIINDRGLAALTLLVAGSDPKDKEIMIRLVMNLIAPGDT